MSLVAVSNALSEGEQKGNRAPAMRGHTTLNFFSSSRLTNAGQSLDGRHAVSIFGTIKIDLTAEALPVGETTIHAYSIFSTLDIAAPDEVGIRITGSSLFSTVKVRGESLDSSIFSVNEYVSPGYHESARRLRIDVTPVFSTVSVKGKKKR